MQMIKTAAVFLAVISAAFAQTFSIIQPFTNTQFAPGASVLVTWTASGFPAGATLTLRLQDIRNGPNTGQPFSTFSGTVPISANSVTVTLPSNLPSGTWAISTVIDGTYYSSPPITVSGAPVSSPVPSGTVPPSPPASPSASPSVSPSAPASTSPSPSASPSAPPTLASTTARSSTTVPTTSTRATTSAGLASSSTTTSSARGSKNPLWYNILPAFLFVLFL